MPCVLLQLDRLCSEIRSCHVKITAGGSVIRSEGKEVPLYATVTREQTPQAPGELAQIFEEHHSRVYRAAYRITGNASDAEDVLQSVFLRLVRREPGTVSYDSLDSYLYRAAINSSLDVLRSRKRAELPLEASPREPGAQPSLELAAWLREALAKLNPRWAEMFILHYVEGYEHREIAQMLDTSAAVVAVTLHRAKGQLKKHYRSLNRGEVSHE